MQGRGETGETRTDHEDVVRGTRHPPHADRALPGFAGAVTSDTRPGLRRVATRGAGRALAASVILSVINDAIRSVATSRAPTRVTAHRWSSHSPEPHLTPALVCLSAGLLPGFGRVAEHAGEFVRTWEREGAGIS
ncbi:hypothetical protein AN216_20185 [Streptomyces oceani]|uniref:Uncharacterized protein n=1 Tax=Streptomyces oceani TaxID=1075402 RepID=A0A1E7JXS3_9ACTN|nr:hypothetical protein AN216_20185 [Streptomyces oceani]